MIAQLTSLYPRTQAEQFARLCAITPSKPWHVFAIPAASPWDAPEWRYIGGWDYRGSLNVCAILRLGDYRAFCYPFGGLTREATRAALDAALQQLNNTGDE